MSTGAGMGLLGMLREDSTSIHPLTMHLKGRVLTTLDEQAGQKMKERLEIAGPSSWEQGDTGDQHRSPQSRAPCVYKGQKEQLRAATKRERVKAPNEGTPARWERKPMWPVGRASWAAQGLHLRPGPALPPAVL